MAVNVLNLKILQQSCKRKQNSYSEERERPKRWFKYIPDDIKMGKQVKIAYTGRTAPFIPNVWTRCGHHPLNKWATVMQYSMTSCIGNYSKHSANLVYQSGATWLRYSVLYAWSPSLSSASVHTSPVPNCFFGLHTNQNTDTMVTMATRVWITCSNIYTGCFKKSFTTLKAYRNLYRGYTQRFELSKCSKTHRVLPRIVMVQCDFHW